MSGEDVGAPPDHLWVHQEGIYRDEFQRTWVAVVEEETSFLRARVQQVQVPLGDAARPSHLLTSQLPLMWQLYPEERYMDNNSRLWQIQHHLMFSGMLRKDPCQKQACEIQKCLQANDYRESKCQAVIQELRKCCARYPRGRSLVCSGFENEEAEKLIPKSASKSSSAETPRAAARFHRATFVYPPDSSGQVAASIE